MNRMYCKCCKCKRWWIQFVKKKKKYWKRVTEHCVSCWWATTKEFWVATMWLHGSQVNYFTTQTSSWIVHDKQVISGLTWKIAMLPISMQALLSLSQSNFHRNPSPSCWAISQDLSKQFNQNLKTNPINNIN